MSATAASKFRSIRDFPELVDYLGDELDWPIVTDDFEEMTFEYSAAELGLDEKTAPKFLEIRRLRPLDKDQPWGIFFIRFDDNKLPVVALRRLLSKLVLNKRSTSNSGDRASWHESDLLLISQTGNLGTQSISFAHFAANPEKTDLPILKVLGWDDDDTGLKIDYVIETLREKLVWPDDPTDSDAWRSQWRDAFTLKNREVIQSSKEMAERLGQLALAVRTRLREVLAIESEEGPIHKLMSVFKENLISDLDTDSFSDMYAQTIAYGLLSARIINPKANTADAAHTQIPITNPFLRDLMETFLNVGGRDHTGGVGLDFDELGINEVVDLLDNTNMEAVLRDFGDRNQKEDPVMHFFEGFLQEYDSKIRKDRGVFYTPQPVVSYIVRSVDEQLRTEFGLEDGLADTTTWGELAKRIADLEIPKGVFPDQSFVQILDPATGTGTFPVEVIELIHKTMMNKWKAQGFNGSQIANLWNDYVPKHLLPRLHGYELMMAPYAIAHMKVGLKLYETGYRFESEERVQIYLTNALEPALDFSGKFDFIIPALANEVAAVNVIKDKKSFTVIIGNPPYSIQSQNLSVTHRAIIDPYRYVDGHLIKEKGALQFEKALQDDCIKFCSFSQTKILSSKAGVLGLIMNHSFIDSPTLRGMRNNLFNSFNKIQVTDLHGSTIKKEQCPDGSSDKNIFDIKQGVGVLICARSTFSPIPTDMSFTEVWGTRDAKYLQLKKILASTSLYDQCNPTAPDYLFRFQSDEARDDFRNGICVTDVFKIGSVGVITARDNLVVDFENQRLLDRANHFRDSNLSNAALCDDLNISLKKGWDIDKARKKMRSESHLEQFIEPICYRPFDVRKIFYHSSLVWGMSYPTMQHMLSGQNLGMLIGRAGQVIGQGEWDILFCTKALSEFNLFRRGGHNLFPLHLNYDNAASQGEMKLEVTTSPNFSSNFLAELALGLKLPQEEPFGLPTGIKSEEIFQYIYAVLNSPGYRSRYKEFLKIDYPRLPLTKSINLFRALSRLGDLLIKLHLLELPPDQVKIGEFIGRDSQVRKIRYTKEDGGTVWIDGKGTINAPAQGANGFRNVPEGVWNFTIGGYQVCEKFLKDRGPAKGRHGQSLSNEAISLYQRILFVIDKTLDARIQVDEAIDAHGGWPDAFITADS